MQLIAMHIAVLATLLGCERTGGLHVDEPLPPDAEGTTSTGGVASSAGLTSAPGEVGGLDDDDDDTTPADDGATSTEGGMADDGGGVGAHTLVPDGARWRVSDLAADGWHTPEHDDAAWDEHIAPLGNGYEVASSWTPSGTTTYLRHRFELDDPAAIEALALRIRRDDGAIVYLNGTEVARTNLPAGAIDASTPAQDEVDGADGYLYFHAAPSPEALRAGTNVLAVELHQRTGNDLVFDARLRAIAGPTEVDALVMQLRTASYGGEYAPSNVGAVWIETAAGVYVRTLGLWADERREHLIRWSGVDGPASPDAVTSATASSHGSRLFEWALDDANGMPVPPGDYVVRAEFTESNSNEGAGAGPTLSLPFTLGDGARVIDPAPTDHYRDLLLLVPEGPNLP